MKNLLDFYFRNTSRFVEDFHSQFLNKEEEQQGKEVQEFISRIQNKFEQIDSEGFDVFGECVEQYVTEKLYPL